MPTRNPRINVTLSPSLDLLVGRMARHQRVSKSQVLRELLEASQASLSKAVALMDQAHEALAEYREWKAEGVALGVASIPSGPDLVGLAERVSERRPSRTQRFSAGAAGAPQGAPNPPASNRGVKSGTKAGKTGAHPGPAIAGTRSSAPRRGTSKGGRS